MSLSSIYGANPNQGATAQTAQSPMVGATPTSGSQPAMSWVTLLALLVALRFLQEAAD
jgi:hypothetical protein